MLPRSGVVYCYVRENEKGEVTDVCSFYSLPSSILGEATAVHHTQAYIIIIIAMVHFNENSANFMPREGHAKHTLLKAAYSYWNVATTVPLQDKLVPYWVVDEP